MRRAKATGSQDLALTNSKLKYLNLRRCAFSDCEANCYLSSNMRQNSEMVMRIEDKQVNRTTTIREDDMEDEQEPREETKSQGARER